MATPTTPTPRAPRGAGPYVVLALALAALGTLAYLGFTFVTTESEQGASPNTTSPPATTAAPAPPSTSESDAGEAAPTTLAAPLEIPWRESPVRSKIP